MIYIPSAQVILEEDEDDYEYSINVPNSAARSHTRRERIPGLGIDSFDDDVPFATISSTQVVLDNDNTSYTNTSRPLPRRSNSGRRSLTSLLAKKSYDTQPSRHRYSSATSISTSSSARASRISSSAVGGSSSGSHSTHAIPPATICYSPPRPSSLYMAAPTSPTMQWSAPAPSTSVISDSSTSTVTDEDITTYHANLARFKAERAERAAELGVDGFDTDRQPYFAYHTRVGDLSSLKIPRAPSKDSHDDKRGLGLGRGLRAYWGGGSSSSDVRRPSSSSSGSVGGSRPQSRNSYLVYDEVMDRQALKEWWDRLGNEPEMAY